MQRTLSEHIAYLEQKIATLKKQLEEPGRAASEQNETEIDLGIAERALAHFRRAFDFEQRLKKNLHDLP